MHTCRKALLVVLFGCLTACTSRPTPSPMPRPDQIVFEEQAVYAALLAQMYPASTYVIMDTTEISPIVGEEDSAEILQRVAPNLPGIEAETVTSFQERNGAPSLLQEDMNLGAPYVLMSRAERKALFSLNQDGWEVFYNRFPEAPGIITFSRVGFNASFDQALCYIGNQRHWLAGAGYFVLLKKTENKWVIEQKLMTWIS